MLSETRKYEERSRAFAVRVIRLVRTFPTTPDGLTVARQLVRAATGVAGNYRASYWSRSRAEFPARLSIVVEEADESVLWLQVTLESDLKRGSVVDLLLEEARQLRAIFSASLRTTRRSLTACEGGATTARPRHRAR